MKDRNYIDKKYPFRFEGPKVGDKVFWLHVSGPLEYETGCTVEDYKVCISEVTIVEVTDSFYFQERDPEDPKQKQENYAIFYWIDRYKPHALSFGIDLFLTREDAELALKLDNKN